MSKRRPRTIPIARFDTPNGPIDVAVAYRFRVYSLLFVSAAPATAGRVLLDFPLHTPNARACDAAALRRIAKAQAARIATTETAFDAFVVAVVGQTPEPFVSDAVRLANTPRIPDTPPPTDAPRCEAVLLAMRSRHGAPPPTPVPSKTP